MEIPLSRTELLDSLVRQKDFLVLIDVLESERVSKRKLRLWDSLVYKLRDWSSETLSDDMFTSKEYDMIVETELCNVWDSRKRKRNTAGLLYLD